MEYVVVPLLRRLEHHGEVPADGVGGGGEGGGQGRLTFWWMSFCSRGRGPARITTEGLCVAPIRHESWSGHPDDPAAA